MTTLLSNHVDNLTEEAHKIKCKDCDCFPEFKSVKDFLIKYKCLSCKKGYSIKIDEQLKKRLKNTFKFSNNDTNKFILSIRKFILMSTWMNGKIMKQHYLKKKNFAAT